MIDTKLQEGLDKIKEIIKENPAATHINMRREDDVLVDIPVVQADWMFRQHPLWVIVDGGFAALSINTSQEEQPVIVPPKPSETVEDDKLPLEEAEPVDEKKTKKTTKSK